LKTSLISLLGDRQDNQDRVSVVEKDGAVLLIAVDGMGGHADGERAAELAVEVIEAAFLKESPPVFDPQGFLHLAIGRAHTAVVDFSADLDIETRARATCALCLVQDDSAYWGHVGDSRVYHLRNRAVHEHTRDHSHIEVLLHEGSITRDELANHPMRNYVERCLGGDAELPRMSISARKQLIEGDVMLVCSDGLWAPIGNDLIASLSNAAASIDKNLATLAESATRSAAPHSDNTSAAALLFSRDEIMN